ncbi:hypothetical protein [Flavonifractor sp. An306]|uniref:hypothetical protein n=1 Tax=Flavonifractor sp. An306 TaxID=1965629 RepID=UPI00174EBA03|nr:hypothetical protein [Flavonifractor sp. An306]
MANVDNWLNLINISYKTLLNNGRNYAAFDHDQLQQCMEIFYTNGAKRILDPMSGYGTIRPCANQYGISTYCVEINTPCYLWQHLTMPQNAPKYITIIDSVIPKANQLPEESVLWEASRRDWIAPIGKSLLEHIYLLLLTESRKLNDMLYDSEKFAIALLLPFSSRLAAMQNGDVQHVKRGSTAVYRNYRDDLTSYLNLLKIKLQYSTEPATMDISNEIRLGDSKVFQFDGERFNFMLTSPPYPNHIDYAKMFGPENELLNELNQKDLLHIPKNLDDPIGSNVVSGKSAGEIWSPHANDFIEKIFSYRKTKKAQDDNRVYYGPYFRNYFYNLQVAYSNIAKYLASSFTGIIIVRNNTARSYIVPVAESIIDIWKNLGFEAKIVDQREMFHVGSKNPQSKGFKAKHMEYIIKIWREAL